MSLPSGYKQLEYIKSTGTQYVDTGVPVKSTSGFEVSFAMTATSGQIGVIGGFTYGGYNHNFAAYDGKWITQYGNNEGYQFGSVDTERHTVSQNVKSGTVYFDGETIKTGLTYYDNTSRTFRLFCYNGGSSYPTFWIGSFKLYSCQIYDNGTLIRDYIPCQTTAGEVGLWDDVNSVFYGNAGTGTFTAGPVMEPPEAPANLQHLIAVRLAWSAVDGASSYNIYRDGTLLGSATETSFVDTTAAENQEYTYAVSAVGSGGESAKTTLTVYTKSGYFLYKPYIESATFQ